MRSGIVIVNKDAGMTSHQVVGKLRRLTGIKKIGHSGTLDPDVTGVLPLCLGQATRVIEYIQDQQKRYRAEVTFGYSTTTQDASGERVDSGSAQDITFDQVANALQGFRGEILQTPPAFSALKINGKRAYDLARAGEQVELKPRFVTIYEIRLLSFDQTADTAKAVFDVTCSKGTYIRTLCQDLGVAVGCPAHMSHLVRTQSGPFTIEDARTLAEIETSIENGTFDSLLLPPSAALPHLKSWDIQDPELLKRIQSGQSISLRPLQLQGCWLEGTQLRVMSQGSGLVAIYEVTRNEHGLDVAKPVKVFS